MKSRTVTLYLAKEDLKGYEKALKRPDDLIRLEPRVERDERPLLFVKVYVPRPPKWKSLLEEAFDLQELQLLGGSASAVLFLTVKDRVFGVTFGYGFALLDESKFVLDFGLKSSLSAMSPGELRNVDVMRPETHALRKRQQTGRSSRLDEFEVDQIIDVIRSATGKTSDTNFAEKVTGTSSLKLSAKLDFDTLAGKCEQSLELYESDAYKKNFSRIDNLRPVNDPLVILSLEERLITTINAGELEAILLSPPQIIDESSIVGFRYQGTRDKTVYTNLEIADYIAGRRENKDISLDEIKRHHVKVSYESEETSIPRWPLFKCLIFEVEKGGHHYILAEGNWFQVDAGFKSRAEAFFQEHLVESNLPNSFAGETEPEYCERVGAIDGLILFDQILFKIPGETAAYELCDILSADRTFYHLKRSVRGSSTLSHLFRQGVMAGEFFAREPNFRQQARNYLAEKDADHIDLIPDALPDTRNYTVRFGIIAKRRANGDFDIPFFSKVSFQSAARRLGAFGYAVELCFVEKDGPEKLAADG